jgi:tetratricopeptide (TPR) repeat protein/predicted Ser/Thr protein kinase
VIGTTISRYHVLSRIGQGGMGEVYLADDPSLGRKVALKFLAPGQASDESARRRLLHEAYAAARLDHPFVCKVYEVGDAGDRPFIAMEYVEGETLRDRLLGGAIPIKDAIRIASEIAEALDSAHKRGIIHRDLKPSNVMLAADGHVKVMDFGVAKHLSGVGVGTMITLTGEIVGTMNYMSPEQINGAPVDARSDIFAFGLLLYEMVTGAHPFQRSSPITTANAILSDTEPPLEDKRPDAPPLLAHVVSRCLEKECDRRYQSLRDVQIELSTLADGTGSSSARRTPAPRKRDRRWAIGVAALVAAVLAVAGFWIWGRLSEPALAFNERDWILISDFQNLTGDPVFEGPLRLALEVGVAQSRYVNVLPQQRLQSALQRMKRSPTERLDESLAAEVAVREGVKGVLSCSISQVGDVYALTARLLDPQSRAAVLTESVQARGKENVLGALDELATRVRRELGESLATISQAAVPLPNATTASLEALKLYADSMREKDDGASNTLLAQALKVDPDFAMAHAEMGRRYYLKPDRETRLEAEKHVAKALALVDRLTPRERLWIQASADDARGLRTRAVDGYRTYLAQYPDDARAWFRMGWTYMAGLSQYEHAVEAFNKVISINPSDAAAHVNLATCYRGQRKYEQAVATYRKAFELNPEMLTGQFVNHEYGSTLIHLGRLDDAAAVFVKMRAQPDATSKARSYRSMAFLEMYRGRYDAAIKELRQAILIDETNKFGVSEYRDRLILARAFSAKDMSAAAGAELDAATRLRTTLSLSPEWLRMLAKLEARRGRVKEARRLVDEMSKRAWDATAGSSANRSMDEDQTYINQAQGEVALAEGRFEEALRLLEAASLSNRDEDLVESVAAAQAASGHLDVAAKRYDELLSAPRFGNEIQELWFRSHVTAGEIDERLGRTDEARKKYEALVKIWKDGDPDLVALKNAKARLAKLK